jgi:hypothetical protein
MLSLTNSVSIAREVAFRARRNWHTAKPAQRDGDGDVVRPLHIPQSEFPRSLYATDGTVVPSEVRTRSAYYSVIACAVSRLPNNTRDARLALYDRAEIALTVELMKAPEISDERAADERLAFERAIIKIEGDARKKEMPKQSQETHRRPFTASLSFFLSSLSVRFNCWAT